MKVVITGGKGLIGRHTVRELKEAGHEVVVYDIKDGQDISSPVALRKFFAQHKPEAVVHLAAWPHPSTSLTYRHYLDGNIVGTFNVAEACAEAKIKKLIYTSSTAYYGYEFSVGKRTPIGNERTLPGYQWAKAKPDHYLPCELWYGISKVCAEALLSVYGLSQKYQVIILRFCPVPHHIDLGLKPAKAAEAIRLALEHEDELWYEVFNIAGTPGLDIRKAQRVLGFAPEYEEEEKEKEKPAPAPSVKEKVEDKENAASD